MSNTKVTELETVIPQTAGVENAAPAEQSAVTPYSLSPITATMQAMTSIILTDYLSAFYADTEQAVINGQLSPVLKLILDKGFARHWTEHNSTFSKLPESAKLDSIREAFKFWNVGVLTKSAYDNLFKAPAVTKGKNTTASVDYTPLITELQALHDNPEYTTEQAEDIAFLISSLTITDTNTAAEAKTFYTVLTTDKDFESFQVYVKTALTAATEKAKAKAAAESMAVQTAEQAAKAKIMARLKR